MRMLSIATPPAAPRALTTTLVFLAAILLGSGLGSLVPAAGAALGGVVDPIILVLVGVLFFELRFAGLGALRRAPRTVLLAVGINFLAVPAIAAGLTWSLPEPAIRLGVLIYCLAPCTDWFLGFTRMARGDTTTGAALLPMQLMLQLALYPVWIAAFIGQPVASILGEAGPTLLSWFVAPAATGIALRLLVRLALPEPAVRVVLEAAGRLVPAVIASLIVCLFATNVGTILAHPTAFTWVLLVVFGFFVCTYALGKLASRLGRLRYPEHALLTMTTSARNAPLMLAVTTAALPGQPLVYAAIVLGMLIEFPHLTALTHLLRRQEARRANRIPVVTA